jgi:hypothetical protein
MMRDLNAKVSLSLPKWVCLSFLYTKMLGVESSLRSASRAKTSFAIEIIEKNLFGGKYQNSSGVK